MRVRDDLKTGKYLDDPRSQNLKTKGSIEMSPHQVSAAVERE